jgi:hypothetical protein
MIVVISPSGTTVWGGCWCTWFHTAYAEKSHSVEGNRALKERLVH